MGERKEEQASRRRLLKGKWTGGGEYKGRKSKAKVVVDDVLKSFKTLDYSLSDWPKFTSAGGTGSSGQVTSGDLQSAEKYCENFLFLRFQEIRPYI